ncbi:WSCD family member [Diplonema papillatum]|nr:WSCD family member [Diplonema papillatum]
MMLLHRLQRNSGLAVKASLAVALCFVLALLVRPDVDLENPEEEAPPPPLVAHASQQITDLLSSQGLLEYTRIMEGFHMTTIATVAVQDESTPPPQIKKFHWRMLVNEAKRLVGIGKKKPAAGSAFADGDEDSKVPPPIVVVNDAVEDKSVLDMPKKRTIGTCHVTRSFLPPDGEDDPPLFWSFPGSGNTWIRLLIEQATGHYTGSVYRDLDIIKVMPGELRCDKTVVAVKGHPNWTPFDLVDGGYKEGQRFSRLSENGREWVPNTDHWYGISGQRPTPTIRAFDAKCEAVRFNRALVVTRNPFAALWAEYQRVKSERIVDGVNGVRPRREACEADFDPADMRGHVISLMQDWVLQFVGYEGFWSGTGAGPSSSSRSRSSSNRPRETPRCRGSQPTCASRWSRPPSARLSLRTTRQSEEKRRRTSNT